MNPATLLRAADGLLTGRQRGVERGWQRTCAVLLRIALQEVLAGYWHYRAPGVNRAKPYVQLLVLPTVAGDDAARTARRAWNGLCRAVHHHTYELSPTAAELRSWHNDVSDLVTRLGPPSRSAEG